MPNLKTYVKEVKDLTNIETKINNITLSNSETAINLAEALQQLKQITFTFTVEKLRNKYEKLKLDKQIEIFNKAQEL
jgi:hypothetical protein